jgi:putative Mg2+ transporter-C (MgtC) family protein
MLVCFWRFALKTHQHNLSSTGSPKEPILDNGYWEAVMISEMEMILRILAAAGLGALVGLERERQNQPAGLRTHMVLVAGAALAMTLSINLAVMFRSQAPNGDPARLAAQVLSGIGFLCAGAILRMGPTIRGLTTATSLWTMAVVGLTVGAGYYITGTAITVLLLAILTLLNLFENRFVNKYTSVRFTIFAIDRPGIEAQIRTAFQEIGLHTESFRADHHLRQQRVKMDAVVRLKPAVPAERLSDRIAAIKGVRVVKYE